MRGTPKECPVHKESSFIFCKTCKRMSCLRCLGCEAHSLQTTSELIGEYDFDFRLSTIKKHKEEAEEHLKEIKRAIKTTGEDMTRVKASLGLLKEKSSFAGEKEKSEIDLVDSAIKFLRNLQEAAYTDVLFNAAQGAIEMMDVGDLITSEIRGYRETFEKTGKSLRGYREEIKNLKTKKQYLNRVRAIDTSDVEDEDKLALSICFANDIIESVSTNPSADPVSGYMAFPGVKRVFDIEKVHSQKLISVGQGIEISEPVPVGIDLIGGKEMFASVSHRGVLAINYNIFGNKVLLADLLEEKRIYIKVEGPTQTGFFDSSMIMLTTKVIPRGCSVEEMFAKGDVKALEGIGDVFATPYTDVSLLNTTRRLMFTSTLGCSHELNVDTGDIKSIDHKIGVLSFASLTGIDTGVKGVFSETNRIRTENTCCASFSFGGGAPEKALNMVGTLNKTFSLNMDGSLSLESQNSQNIICFVIPSSTNPKNISAAMKIYEDGNFCVGTTQTRLANPFMFRKYQSIVRLYQDIFLVNDGNTSKWCLVKIVVP